MLEVHGPCFEQQVRTFSFIPSASSSPTYIYRLAPRVFTQIQRVKSMTTNISPILQLQKMNKQQGPLTWFLQLKCLPPTAF